MLPKLKLPWKKTHAILQRFAYCTDLWQGQEYLRATGSFEDGQKSECTGDDKEKAAPYSMAQLFNSIVLTAKGQEDNLKIGFELITCCLVAMIYSILNSLTLPIYL